MIIIYNIGNNNVALPTPPGQQYSSAPTPQISKPNKKTQSLPITPLQDSTPAGQHKRKHEEITPYPLPYPLVDVGPANVAVPTNRVNLPPINTINDNFILQELANCKKEVENLRAMEREQAIKALELAAEVKQMQIRIAEKDQRIAWFEKNFDKVVNKQWSPSTTTTSTKPTTYTKTSTSPSSQLSKSSSSDEEYVTVDSEEDKDKPIPPPPKATPKKTPRNKKVIKGTKELPQRNKAKKPYNASTSD